MPFCLIFTKSFGLVNSRSQNYDIFCGNAVRIMSKYSVSPIYSFFGAVSLCCITELCNAYPTFYQALDFTEFRKLSRLPERITPLKEFLLFI